MNLPLKELVVARMPCALALVTLELTRDLIN